MSNADDMVLVPREPTEDHLASIAMRIDHSYGICPPQQQENLRRSARQVYEEVTGQGFYKLAAAPQPAAQFAQHADLLTQAIQRLNSNPYSLTKDECIQVLRELRGEQPAAQPERCSKQPAPVDYPSAYQLYQCTGVGVRQSEAKPIDPQEVMRLREALEDAIGLIEHFGGNAKRQRAALARAVGATK